MPDSVRQRWLFAVAALVLSVGLIAIFGGFARSDTPRPTFEAGTARDLGRFSILVHEARVVDLDEDGEAFDDGLPRLLVDATITNISDESTSFGSRLIGYQPPGAEILANEPNTVTFHPDLKRRVDVEIILDGELDGPTIGLWLGAQVYDWTNLINPGPEWSVPNWAAYVTDVPVTDERSR